MCSRHVCITEYFYIRSYCEIHRIFLLNIMSYVYNNYLRPYVFSKISSNNKYIF
jgi:hypothetical protein